MTKGLIVLIDPDSGIQPLIQQDIEMVRKLDKNHVRRDVLKLPPVGKGIARLRIQLPDCLQGFRQLFHIGAAALCQIGQPVCRNVLQMVLYQTFHERREDSAALCLQQQTFGQIPCTHACRIQPFDDAQKAFHILSGNAVGFRDILRVLRHISPGIQALQHEIQNLSVQSREFLLHQLGAQILCQTLSLIHTEIEVLPVVCICIGTEKRGVAPILVSIQPLLGLLFFLFVLFLLRCLLHDVNHRIFQGQLTDIARQLLGIHLQNLCRLNHLLGQYLPLFGLQPELHGIIDCHSVRLP